jgi:anionic cell wall polymer biosynthesis LytR-Cps2A-Psr (LCP) family protein
VYVLNKNSIIVPTKLQTWILFFILLLLLLLLLLILTVSGYVHGGSGTTIHNAIQYNAKKKTYTLKTIHNTKITNTIHKRKQEYKAI